MPAVAKLVALYCGQGMAHLLEIYNNGNVNGVADHLVLIDFGGNNSQGGKAADYVADKLGAQLAAQRTPTIDLMILSHQDRDHVCLLKLLGEKLGEKGIVPIQLGQVYAGGHQWIDSNIATVNNFLKLANVKALHFKELKVKAFQPYRRDYHEAFNAEDADHLGTFGKITVRVAVAQLPIPSSKMDIIRNGSSAVIVIENGNKSIILPGDATYQTLAEVNKLYSSWGNMPLIPRVTALEVPHHGALRTAVQNYDPHATLDTFNFKIIEEFAEHLKPDEIFASAGLRNKEGHPVKELLDVFHPFVAATVTATEYVAFVFNDKDMKNKDLKKKKDLKQWKKDMKNKDVCDRFKNFKENFAKRTTIVRMTDGTAKTTNIEVTLHETVLKGAAVRNTRTLDEILAAQGLGPLTLPRRSPVYAQAPPHPSPVYAPAPTPEERGTAAPPPAAA